MLCLILLVKTFFIKDFGRGIMKKIVLLTIFFLLAFSSLVIAGDIDGLWWMPDMGSSEALMMRENGSMVVALEFKLEPFGATDGCALLGTQTGNIISLQDTDFCAVSITATMTLTSPTTATVKIHNCTPKLFGWHCIFPSGVSFNIEKLF
jgi:hypothetical protein